MGVTTKTSTGDAAAVAVLAGEIEIEIAIGPGLHLHQWVGNADQAQTHIVAISTGSYPGQTRVRVSHPRTGSHERLVQPHGTRRATADAATRCMTSTTEAIPPADLVMEACLKPGRGGAAVEQINLHTHTNSKYSIHFFRVVCS